MQSWSVLPSRERPNALEEFVEAMLLMQREFQYGHWVELERADRSFETIRTTFRAVVKSWLKHQWPAAPDLDWWKQNLDNVRVVSREEKIWLAPKGTIFRRGVTPSGGEVLYHFQGLPSEEVILALGLLIEKGIITHEIRCNEPLPMGVMERFPSVEVFKDDNHDCWVMM